MNISFPAVARQRIAICALLALSVLSGCADLAGVGGDSHYGCKAPAGVQCNSVSGNYANALQNNLPFQQVARPVGEAKDGVVQPPPRPTTAPPVGGLVAEPLRSRARVIRMWVRAWEDQDHDLVDQSYVYMQIDAGRWMIEHAQARAREAFAPIRSPAGLSRPDGAAATQPLRPTPAAEEPVPNAAPAAGVPVNPAG